MNSARDLILSKIGRALAQAPFDSPDGREESEPFSGEELSLEELKDQFIHRWQTVGGQCWTAGNQSRAGEIIGEILGGYQGREAAVAPSALELMPGLSEIFSETGLKAGDPFPSRAAGTSIGVTGADLALAYSGSLLIASHEPGALSASLLPPVHLALVPVNRLVGSLAGAIDRIRKMERPRAAVFITGPSRTADIELTLVKGVHGPEKTLAVLLDYEPFNSRDL